MGNCCGKQSAKHVELASSGSDTALAKDGNRRKNMSTATSNSSLASSGKSTEFVKDDDRKTAAATPEPGTAQKLRDSLNEFYAATETAQFRRPEKPASEESRMRNLISRCILYSNPRENVFDELTRLAATVALCTPSIFPVGPVLHPC